MKPHLRGSLFEKKKKIKRRGVSELSENPERELEEINLVG